MLIAYYIILSHLLAAMLSVLIIIQCSRAEGDLPKDYTPEEWRAFLWLFVPPINLLCLFGLSIVFPVRLATKPFKALMRRLSKIILRALTFLSKEL